jgi:hypothetical protein
MARGWESKSIEAQQAEAEAARAAQAAPAATPEMRERQSRREGLLLSRSRALSALQGACHASHRALLERTLAHLDEALQALDESAGSEPARTPRER